MKYRTKLYLALMGLGVFSSFLALEIIYYETKGQLLTQMKSQLHSVVATTAVLIDGEVLKQFHSRADESTPPYVKFKEELQRVRDANRRQHIFIKYLYVLAPDPKDPKEMYFIIDAEQDPLELSHFGDPAPEADVRGLQENDNLSKPYSPDRFIIDEWGTWLSGFAPIRDKNGNYIATLGADVKASDVLAVMFRLLRYEFFALFGAMFVAILGAFILGHRASYALHLLHDAVKKIGDGHFETRIYLKTKDEFNDLAEAVNEMAHGLQERERIKSNFAHYVSNHVFERIVNAEELKLEGERRKITVLFSDIREFTHFAEQHPPEQVVALLNEYFEKMINVIFKNLGTLDKFLGDGLMVEFGAPIEDAAQEKHAIMAALEMQEELKKLCIKWEGEGKPLIKMGIGIHTGVAVVGNIGSEQRMEYTAIGDTVNVASRIQAASKKLNAAILVSETTYTAIKNEFSFEKLGLIELPGRTESINVYQLDTVSK